MFGNILNNSQIRNACNKSDITIDPFDDTKLKLAHYPLTAGSVLWATEKTPKGLQKHDLRADFRNNEPYRFEPLEYAIVEIAEFIKLSDGITGHFIPSSSLIELGFGLTAGKIDPGYGHLGGKQQQIRFGLKNLKNEKNQLAPFQVIAHVYFVDLRGLNNMGIKLTRRELEFLMERAPRYLRAQDDGVDYGTGE